MGGGEFERNFCAIYTLTLKDFFQLTDVLRAFIIPLLIFPYIKVNC